MPNIVSVPNPADPEPSENPNTDDFKSAIKPS